MDAELRLNRGDGTDVYVKKRRHFSHYVIVSLFFVATLSSENQCEVGHDLVRRQRYEGRTE